MKLKDRTGVKNRDRLATIVNLSILLAVVPACSATAGHGLLRRPAGSVATQPGQTQPYLAYRPAFRLPRAKPLYLSNYAGANYPSRAPGAGVSPTEFRMLTGRPVNP